LNIAPVNSFASGKEISMPTKEQVAIFLAQRHYEIESGVTQIYRLNDRVDVEGSPTEPIKLLEVNENTVPSGIVPIQFGPNPAIGIHYPSVIVEVTPEEFQRIQTEDLPLPGGWRLGNPIPRCEDAVNEHAG
jgi:hypothetical protein